MEVKEFKASFILQLLLIGFLLSSCGVMKRTPSERSNAVIGSGIASWYGPNFHGNLTANGEKYNMDEYTAAHKTLPFNTIVRVDNIDNGKSVLVRINDRGPYIANRIIDLSRRAAREIDMIGSGTAHVRLVLISEGDRPVDLQNISSQESYTVQLAAFENEQEAVSKMNGISGSRVEEVTVSGKTVFRVYYGMYQSVSEAQNALDLLTQQGHNGFVKQIEN